MSFCSLIKNFKFMKIQTFKFIALLALLMGWFSCSNDDDPYRFQWDDSTQQEEYRPINPGEESSYFAIDENIISFAVPYLVGTKTLEYLPHPADGLNSHSWFILLIMAEGTDVTSLTPIITLAPSVTITWIHDRNEQGAANQVDYTGIAEVGAFNFKHQIDFTVMAPDGSTVTYMCLAVAIGDVLHRP